jgi:outer membrane protein assembly factor BamB
MRARLPRTRVVPAALACLALALVLTAGLALRGQDRAAPSAVTAAKDVLPFGPALMLPTDAGLAQKLQAAREYARDRRWEDAARLLRDLLDRPEDVFLPITRRGPDGQEVTTAVSLRAEINRLIAGLPKPGLEAYEALVGPGARQALTEAKREPAAVALIVQRFPHTKAGRQAAELLGAHHLDRGHFDLATGYFDHILRSADVEPPLPLTLFQAAVAFRRAGLAERAEQTWKRLAAAAPEGITAGGSTVSLAELEKELNRHAAAATDVADSTFLPEARWPHETGADGPAWAWVQDAVRRQEAALQPVLPAFTALAVGGKVVYRNDRGIRAVDPRSGATAWECPSELSLDRLVRAPETHAHVGSWVEAYLASHPNVLLENTLLGSLSTDGRRVYTVEDLPVPPRPGSYFAFHESQGQGLALADAPELTGAVLHSRLLALDAASGKVVWEAGGPHSALRRDCYFLGPPLPLGGKLYVPVQRGFDLRLLCLEPTTGDVLWAQTLATFRARLAVDGGRRLHAVRLVYGDGLLVCPTNAGGVVAFDLVGRSLAWAHAYREEPPPPPDPTPFMRGRGRRARLNLVTEPPNLTSEWKVSAPAVADGKVIFAAPDAPELRCLDMHDGSLVWQVKRGENDLFLAGTCEEKVLVVGKGQVRAFNLADGKSLWRCDTPTPAGRGALVADAYHLPVRGADGKAEAIVLDLARGVVASRSTLPDRDVVEALPPPDGLLPAVPGPLGARIAGLVAQLGSDCSAERDAAAAALDALGPAALDALRKAASGPDPDTSRRAAALARAAARRRDTAEAIEPQNLRLQYKDTPLAEAVADFARKSGLAIKLAPDITKPGDRKVTLDTGDVTFWEAFDRFCTAAGLVELLPPAPANSGIVSSSSVVVVGGRLGAPYPTDVMRTSPDERPLELMLADGKPAALPAVTAGSLRVRAVPPDTPLLHHKKEDGELLFGLDLTADGRLHCQKPVGVRIEQALDEEGRPLAQLATVLKPSPSAAAARSGVTVNGLPLTGPADEPEGLAARLVPIRLKSAGDKPPRKLKELRGTVVAQVRTPQETLVEVPDVLNAAGKVVKGRRGGEVKVLDAKIENGHVRLKVAVEGVSRGLTDVPPNPFGGNIMINGKRLGDEDLLSSLNFALLDENGKPFRVTRAISTGLRSGAAHEYDLTYQPEAGQSEAARFIYQDRRTLFVEVPFVLKDVPLP